MSGTRWSKTCQQQEPTVSAPGANYYDGCQTSNVRRRNMSRSRESRRRGSRKQTKITYAARAKTLSRFKKKYHGAQGFALLGHSLSQVPALTSGLKKNVLSFRLSFFVMKAHVNNSYIRNIHNNTTLIVRNMFSFYQ